MTGSVSLVPPPLYIPQDVDMTAVKAQVAASGVSAPPEAMPGLLAVVNQAHADGINLKIVLLDHNPPNDTPLRDISTVVGADYPDATVLTLSPSYVGSYSTHFPRVTLEAGEDIGRALVGVTEQAARPGQASVQLEHDVRARPGALVQAVEVLRADRVEQPGPLELDQAAVRGGRPSAPHRAVAPHLPGAPADLRVGQVRTPLEQLRGQRVARPHALRPAEVGDARVRRDPRAGQDRDPWSARRPGSVRSVRSIRRHSWHGTDRTPRDAGRAALRRPAPCTAAVSA